MIARIHPGDGDTGDEDDSVGGSGECDGLGGSRAPESRGRGRPPTTPVDRPSTPSLLSLNNRHRRYAANMYQTMR